MFNKCYVAFWRLTQFMLDILMLCRIMLFIKVYVSLRRYQGLYHITTINHGLLKCLVGICQHNQRCDTLILREWAFNKRSVTFWRLSQLGYSIDINQGFCHNVTLISVLSYCDVYHSFVALATLIKGFVTLWH